VPSIKNLSTHGLPFGLMFHHFHGDHEQPMGQGSITAAQFEKIIRDVGVENILDPNVWLDKLSHGALHPNETCITFDDALLGQYNYALPVLDDYGIKAFWFIYSSVFEGKIEVLEIYRRFRNCYFLDFDDFYDSFINECNRQFPDMENVVDKLDVKHIDAIKKKFPFYSERDVAFRLIRDEHLTDRQYCSVMSELISKKSLSEQFLAKDLWLGNEDLKELSKSSHVIGLHGYDHVTDMAGLSYKDQLDQYQRNIDHLKAVTGADPITMAHPNNSFCGATLDILRDLGIQLGFRSNLDKLVDHEHPNFDLLVPRIDHSRLL
jgi:peptidoglycan/xylan/chitin deacetylase (PgdA/CDA1 family)